MKKQDRIEFLIKEVYELIDLSKVYYDMGKDINNISKRIDKHFEELKILMDKKLQ